MVNEMILNEDVLKVGPVDLLVAIFNFTHLV